MAITVAPIQSLFSNGTSCLFFIFVGVRVCFVCPFACNYNSTDLWAVELLKTKL
jgi:hypothetical protein